MLVDIQIDKLTDCLVERTTGNVVDTEYVKRAAAMKKKEFAGWKFNWCVPQKCGYEFMNCLWQVTIQYKAG